MLSLHFKRNCAKALDDLFAFWASLPLSRALLMEYRTKMDHLAPSTINVRMSAVRKLVGEARRLGVIESEETANPQRFKCQKTRVCGKNAMLAVWNELQSEQKMSNKYKSVATFVCLLLLGCGSSANNGPPTNPSPPGASFPQITAISPATTAAGSGDVTVSITGAGFDTSSVVEIGSTAIPTKDISTTSLTATISASFLLTPTVLAIRVQDSTGSGTTISASSSFSVSSVSGTGTIDGIASISNANALGNSDSVLPSLSIDGRFVAFASSSTNLTTPDTGGYYQIYLQDTCLNALQCTPKVIPVSVNTGGSFGNGDSGSLLTSVSATAISGDGRLIVFRSEATNLTVDNTGGHQQIFVRDTCTGVSGCSPSTILVSQSNTGFSGDNDSRDPAISSDGRFIAFASAASNLAGQADGKEDQIYLRDTCYLATSPCSPNTSLVSVNEMGSPGKLNSDYPSISSSGRYVSFGSASDDILAGVFGMNIYTRDTCVGAGSPCTASTSLISQNVSNPNGTGSNLVSAISGNGRFVVYIADFQIITPTGIKSTGTGGLVVRDTCLGASSCTPALVSLPTSAGQDPSLPVLSADGSVVMYLSIPSTGSGYTAAYVENTCQSGTSGCQSHPVSLNLGPDGSGPNANTGPSALSPDGHRAALSSAATNIAPAGNLTNGHDQIYTTPTTF